MTTHETQPETLDTTSDMDRGQLTQGSAPRTEPEFSETGAAAAPLDEPAREPIREQPVESTPTPGATDQTLFGDNELSDFHSRWTQVQAAFVDDPRDCVQKADSLVSDVVDRLTAGFAQARSGLEEQWSRGEQVSTEDLRLALQRYRDFFERLLAV